MRAQSFALENISGNIANSQTIGFKREDTSFVDLIPDASPLKQVAGSVVANSRSTNNVQGDVQTASIGTLHGDQRQRLLRGREADRILPAARRPSAASSSMPGAATSVPTATAIW